MLQVGIRVPSFAWPDLSFADAQALMDYCRRVEATGFAGIWALDHLLESPALYGVSWLDPLHVMTSAAAVTTSVSIGSAALVMPLRHPVLLAKELASMQLLSGGRTILGAATGWDEAEFNAIGVPLRERGKRTDECLAIVRALLREESVEYQGTWFSLDGLTIYPRVPTPLPVWIAGGSLGHAPETPDRPYIAPAVLARIREADGWMSRSSGSDADEVQADWQVVKADLRDHGRDPETLVFGHTQFVHIVETSSREDALAEQLPHFARVMGGHRTADHLAASYLLGTTEEIQARVSDLVAAGLQYLIATPVSDDPGQLDLINKYIHQPFNSVA